jgi:hypothetical protein
MLRIKISDGEVFNELTGEFGDSNSGVVLELEHSLVSVSRWESKWEKPFLGSEDKTQEQTLDYIGMMSLNDEVPPAVLSRLSADNVNRINEYINAKMTATTFQERRKQSPSRETITAELIYYWMTALQIPFECQHWHLNRLLTLIKICNIKNAPAEKMTAADAASHQRDLNAQRKAQLGTRG